MPTMKQVTIDELREKPLAELVNIALMELEHTWFWFLTGMISAKASYDYRSISNDLWRAGHSPGGQGDRTEAIALLQRLKAILHSEESDHKM